MGRDLVIDRLVQSAVDRCRERITSATKRVDRGTQRSGEPGILKEPPSFTETMKRFRGL